MPTTSFSGFSRPKFTQVPNAIIDDLMVELNESQLKVLLYITRKTFGWHKSFDAISLSQMEAGTGMSPSSVKRACQDLAAKGIISRINQSSAENGNEATVYGLNEDPGAPLAASVKLVTRVRRKKRLAKLREKIGAACEWTCKYCLKTGDSERGPDLRPWHLDHFYPRSLGGDSGSDNLVLACATCNLAKRDSLVADYLAAVAR